MSAPTYELHLHPPAYPAKCFPARCRHEPQFVMQHAVHIVPCKRGGNTIEIDHAVCLACGKPMPCTIGGNVLVDLNMLFTKLGWHAGIGGRIIELRDKWSRIAAGLFGPKGWNGRHERIARLIDPTLTMKIKLQGVGRRLRRRSRINRRERWIGTVSFDRSLVREVPL